MLQAARTSKSVGKQRGAGHVRAQRSTVVPAATGEDPEFQELCCCRNYLKGTRMELHVHIHGLDVHMNIQPDAFKFMQACAAQGAEPPALLEKLEGAEEKDCY